jgi:hypothetical protein
MYEENCKPLDEGDATAVFAQQFAEIRRRAANDRAAEVAPQNVVRWADKSNQPDVAAMCRRLLLPGSGIRGLENLTELSKLAQSGNACLICLNHRSNFDVPTLCALIGDHSDPAVFDQLIWIAGRKLEEDRGMTSSLAQCFNRVIVTPHSWFESQHSDDEIRQARRINIATERAIAQLRTRGWVFALFPTGTRIRPGDESTQQAIAATYSYLHLFQYMVLCHIDGCTLPVSKDCDLTHETPKLDKVIYTFGPVQRTDQWLAGATQRFATLNRRAATARAITEDIEALKF